MPPPRRLEILPQPDDVTCGPTCLHAVYRYYGDSVDLEAVIEGVEALHHGGTLGALLGKHALSRGYDATLYSYNLKVFDPTWFRPEGPDLRERLAARHRAKRGPRQHRATGAYLEFLDLGGRIEFEDLSPALLCRLVGQGAPVLAGVSATYLYGEARERKGKPDDVRGDPVGHFVVVRGVDGDVGIVSVADPYLDTERFEGHYYEVGIQRFLNSVLLGIVSYDANLLVLRPRNRGGS